MDPAVPDEVAELGRPLDRLGRQHGVIVRHLGQLGARGVSRYLANRTARACVPDGRHTQVAGRCPDREGPESPRPDIPTRRPVRPLKGPPTPRWGRRSLIGDARRRPSRCVTRSLRERPMSAQVARREFAKGVVDAAIRKARATLGRKSRRAFDHLLWNVQSRSACSRPSRHVGQRRGGVARTRSSEDSSPSPSIAGAGPAGRGVGARTARRRSGSSRRSPTTWWPSIGSPPCCCGPGSSGPAGRRRQRQRWFCHVGRGGSLRTAGFPIALTRRMAHEFSRAPAAFPIDFALRWAQVRGLGGSDDLARAVAGSRLGRDLTATTSGPR